MKVLGSFGSKSITNQFCLDVQLIVERNKDNFITKEVSSRFVCSSCNLKSLLRLRMKKKQISDFKNDQNFFKVDGKCF